MMNPRYLQRFGEPPPFGDPIARAALRYDPEAPYGDPELEGTEGQRQFDPPDVQPSMNKNSMVATPSTAQMAADMTPNVYRPENGEPYTNTGAPWHQGQLPAFPRGDLLVSSSPLDERINPIPGGAGYNDASEMASSTPMSQPSVTAPPSAPMENPIVRAGRERAESANDPYLNYDPEVPIRATRQVLQPSPEMATGMVGVTQAQMREPAAVTAPPPTEAPPESTMAMLIRQRLGNVLPDRKDYPVSKWAKLAAVALGAGQGYYNAANPNARPIDASEAVQNLTFGRKYIDAMGKHQRTNKNLDEQIKLVGEAEERTEAAASRKAALARQIRQDDLTDKDRDEAHALGNLRLSLDLANQGFKNVVDPTVPAAPGVIRFSNPMDKTGKGFVEGTPTKAMFTITDPKMAKRFNGNPGMEIPWTVLEKILDADRAVEIAKIQAGSKQPTKLDPDVILLEEARAPGTYSPAVIIEARRQRSENHRPPSSTIMMPSLAPGSDGSVNPTVASMANYDTAMPLRPTRNPVAIKEWDDLLKQIKNVNPKFQVTGSRVVSDFARGKPADSINAINTGAGHVGMLANAARALDSGDIKLLNKIANYLGGQAGSDKLAVYKTIVHRLGPEITRAYVGAGGALNDRIGTEEDFDPALGTKVILGNIGITANLFDSKIKALGYQLEHGAPGRKFEGYISPEAQNVFDRFVLKPPAPNELTGAQQQRDGGGGVQEWGRDAQGRPVRVRK